MPSNNDPILLLCSKGAASRAVYHALRAQHPVEVLVEQTVDRKTFLKRRVKKLGKRTVAGQLAFMTTILPVLKRRSQGRLATLKSRYQLNTSPFDPADVHHVQSVNSKAARKFIADRSPSVIVLSGTRILSKKTLAATDVPIINIHAGITPTYRGVHGGYWALYENETDLVGTTIHFVDAGIDTGGIIDQLFFSPEPEDNFATYPTHHIGIALPRLVEITKLLAAGKTLPKFEGNAPPRSVLRSHPTAWSYLQGRSRGIR